MQDMGQGSAKIMKETLKTKVAQAIRNMILAGEIGSGQRIVPAELAERLDIGRGSIREALMELETEGLVTSSPYRGTYVTELSQSEIREILTIRSMLETYAVRELRDILLEEDIQNLRKIVDEMQQATERKDIGAVVRLDAQFHGYFVHKVSQSVLYETWSYTNSRLAYVFFAALCPRGFLPVDQIPDHHYDLIATLEKCLLGQCSLEDYSKAISDHYMRLV